MLIAHLLISIFKIKVAVNIPVIVTIAASFAMADALDGTGVAKELASNLVRYFEFFLFSLTLHDCF